MAYLVRYLAHEVALALHLPALSLGFWVKMMLAIGREGYDHHRNKLGSSYI
jgi:hypothetical protein